MAPRVSAELQPRSEAGQEAHLTVGERHIDLHSVESALLGVYSTGEEACCRGAEEKEGEADEGCLEPALAIHLAVLENLPAIGDEVL